MRRSLNIAIDWGNTNIKIGVFKNEKPEKLFFNVQEKEVMALSRQYQPAYIIISKTGNIPPTIFNQLNKQYNIFTITNNTSLPIINGYQPPEKLGIDRLAGVTGASKLYPYQNSLVIDLGTCITYDFIDQENFYQGGAISPGYQMRLQAMHAFTSQLPELEPTLKEQQLENLPWIGKNTADCMYSGATQGIIGELRQIIRMYHNKFAPLNVIICGGDADFFARKIKAAKFVIPELVLIGLNRILQYNVSKK